MIDVVVDDERCTGCGICASYCPYGAAEVEEGRVVLLDSCVRCTACVDVCPEYALSLERRPPAAAEGVSPGTSGCRSPSRPLADAPR